MLKDKGIVDELTVKAIRLQFAHITRHDDWSEDASNKVLDDKCVLLVRAHNTQRLPPIHSPTLHPRTLLTAACAHTALCVCDCGVVHQVRVL